MKSLRLITSVSATIFCGAFAMVAAFHGNLEITLWAVSSTLWSTVVAMMSLK